MNELLLDDADRREAVTGSRENATKEINANLLILISLIILHYFKCGTKAHLLFLYT